MSALPADGNAALLLDSLDDRTRQILERRRRTMVVKRRGWWMRRALAIADIVGLVAAFSVAQLIYRYSGAGDGVGAFASTAEYVLFVLSLPVWVVLAKLYGLYDRDEERTDHTTSDDLMRVFHLVTVVVWMLYATAVVTHAFSPVPTKLLAFWLGSIVCVVIGRSTARAVIRRRIEYLQNTIIIGAGDVGQMIAKKLLNHPEYGINLVGFVDATPKDRDPALRHITVIDGVGDLTGLVRLLDIDRVIFAFSSDSHDDVLAMIDTLREMDVQVDIVPRLFESLPPTVHVQALEGVPLVGLPPMHLSRSSLFVKRSLDLGLSAAGIVVLAPLFALLALLIRLDSRGPVFYRHDRVGRHGAPFRLFKFRTMFLESCRGDDYGGENAEQEFQRLMSDPLRRHEFDVSYKLQEDPRVTRVGRFLRGTSLDELPQLINVVLGHISLVGPRPVTHGELDRYGDDVGRFLSIRPGITGYWQINGRSRLEYEDRVRLDLSYISGWSLGLDLNILAKTVKVLLTRHGAV